jgi:hypothetical protein
MAPTAAVLNESAPPPDQASRAGAVYCARSVTEPQRMRPTAAEEEWVSELEVTDTVGWRPLRSEPPHDCQSGVAGAPYAGEEARMGHWGPGSPHRAPPPLSSQAAIRARAERVSGGHAERSGWGPVWRVQSEAA